MGKQEVIEFEISERCSGALWEIVWERGWQEQKSFSLFIRKGPFLSLLEELVPSRLICEFHVGCVMERRPPNFGYRSSKERNGGRLFFYYWRDVTEEVFAQSRFHDKNGLRDLEAVALAMSNPQNYEELIGLGWDGPFEGFGRCSQVKVHFKNEQWAGIERWEELQEDPLKSALNGFEGGLLDLKGGPLSSEREKLLEWQWLSADAPTDKGITAEQVIRELHRLFSQD